MKTKKRYTVIDKEEPRGQSVALNGIPCTARHCVTELNALYEENKELKMITDLFSDRELERLKEENKMLKHTIFKIAQELQNKKSLDELMEILR